MKKYEVIDISGDVGIRAYGRSREEAIIHASLGMYSLITDPQTITETKTIHVSVDNPEPDGLLVSWLNELIFHFDTYGFIGKTIHFDRFSNNNITASISGEEFDPERHEGKLLIKAATYHKLRMKKMNDAWEIDVIFDI
jgi:SHS2 domain-containing protein